jgi:replicative DNA helicase
MADGIVELIKSRIDAPVSQVGLSTGFGKFDNCIGGGLRPSTVSVIAARTKGFKSGLALNVAVHVSSLKIPVLYIDTELTKSEQQFRMASCLSRTNIENVETGKIRNDEGELNKLRNSLKKINDVRPFDHKNVVGIPFEDQISIMRRWLFTSPGIQLNGKAKPSLIIFDYIKLMDSEGMRDMAEYQKIGFMVSTLHNFAVKYDVPILTFIQLNRDGIVREDSSAISQSDRVAWFCSNISIFKPKSQEEIAHEEENGIFNAGNFKLVPLHCRHGKGIDPGDYINMHIIGEHFKVIEGNMHSENLLISNTEEETEDEEIRF